MVRFAFRLLIQIGFVVIPTILSAVPMSKMGMPIANEETSTPLRASTTGTAFLPSVLHVPLTCFPGFTETEPNDNAGQANGPLCLGHTYQGLPDRNDYFYIDIAEDGELLKVNLLNYPDPHIQLQLYYQQVSNLVLLAYDVNGSNGYEIVVEHLDAGRYYIRIFNPNPSSTLPYTLIVNPSTDCLAGPQENEPNNNVDQANGPLCFGRPSTGLPNDHFDIFFLDAWMGPITVELANHAGGSDVQLQLHYLQLSTLPIGKDIDGSNGYRIDVPIVPAGRYYILISNPDESGGPTPYSLTATFSMSR